MQALTWKEIRILQRWSQCEKYAEVQDVGIATSRRPRILAQFRPSSLLTWTGHWPLGLVSHSKRRRVSAVKVHTLRKHGSINSGQRLFFEDVRCDEKYHGAVCQRPSAASTTESAVVSTDSTYQSTDPVDLSFDAGLPSTTRSLLNDGWVEFDNGTHAVYVQLGTCC